MGTENLYRRPSRRAQHADDTKKSLIRAARVEFAAGGYGATSLAAIAGRARVTKGALYHHFPRGKLALFLAVFEQLEAELVASVTEAAASVEGDDPWERIDAALWAFVRHSAEPEYLQVVLRDGPRELAMGQQREIDQREAVQVIEAMLTALAAAGELPPLPTAVLSRVCLGALTEGAQAIAQAPDPTRVIGEVHDVLWALLQGLRELARR